MSLIKFGLALPYVSARKVAQLSQLAEESGWDGCFLGDAIWCEDPMIGLAAAAMTTRHIRLGTMITPMPLRRRGRWPANLWRWIACLMAD